MQAVNIKIMLQQSGQSKRAEGTGDEYLEKGRRPAPGKNWTARRLGGNCSFSRALRKNVERSENALGGHYSYQSQRSADEGSMGRRIPSKYLKLTKREKSWTKGLLAPLKKATKNSDGDTRSSGEKH